MILLALSGCARGYYGRTDSDAMKPVNGVLTIENATGGEVYATQQSFQHMERDGVKVRIVGNCGSACILILTHRNVCYAPDAEFVFHGASTELLSRRFEQSLPGKISEWSRANNAMTDPNRFTRISGANLAKLDTSNRTCS
jgi:hypothetical protein